MRAAPTGTVLATAAAAPPAADVGFVGRRIELGELEVRLRLPEGRLVTLVGPGGIGKSRLARELLTRSSFGGREHWVELQDLGDEPAVLARLALLLGVDTNERRDLVDRIASRLAGAPTLIVLDNAEHLPQLGALADRLLHAAPSLRVLLTSRVRTRSASEWAFPVAGLAVPDSDSRDLEAAASFDAVRLFDARARGARRGFDLALHLAAVIDIVDAVGGMPLAIELAAACVRLLPPEEIARELHASLAVLERDPALPGGPARPEHHSMRVVLERTWQLLAPAERSALASLSLPTTTSGLDCPFPATRPMRATTSSTTASAKRPSPCPSPARWPSSGSAWPSSPARAGAGLASSEFRAGRHRHYFACSRLRYSASARMRVRTNSSLS